MLVRRSPDLGLPPAAAALSTIPLPPSPARLLLPNARHQPPPCRPAAATRPHDRISRRGARE
ncbi:hypothetical protein U9M48_030710 [Paspalum notatum var. saurae]|uniref:Uncharacterized protein n=1 Tax=Paspalum notatum var. saurae TaxID=547442 RepID=A0AAQ3X2J6_PASNO